MTLISTPASSRLVAAEWLLYLPRYSRHTYASHLVQAGVPLLFVASALGHSDTRMVEKHYGHLAPSQVAEMIRANLPSFGAAPQSKARNIRG